MERFEERLESAFVAGDWGSAFREASAWKLVLERTRAKNSRPFFVLNVVHLIRGEFADAWRMHAQALEEPGDIEQVKTWVEAFRDRHPQSSHAHLILGLFLSQAGQSEQSVDAYKAAAALDALGDAMPMAVPRIATQIT